MAIHSIIHNFELLLSALLPGKIIIIKNNRNLLNNFDEPSGQIILFRAAVLI